MSRCGQRDLVGYDRAETFRSAVSAKRISASFQADPVVAAPVGIQPPKGVPGAAVSRVGRVRLVGVSLAVLRPVQRQAVVEVAARYSVCCSDASAVGAERAAWR